MKKRQKKQDAPQGNRSPDLSDEFTHFRLCHVCLHLNESSSTIVRCEECQKYLSIEPVWHYFDQKKRGAVLPHSTGIQAEDTEEEPLNDKRSPLLNGLSVLW